MDFSKLDLSKNQALAREIVLQGINQSFKNRDEFQKLRNQLTKKFKGPLLSNLAKRKIWCKLGSDNCRLNSQIFLFFKIQ